MTASSHNHGFTLLEVLIAMVLLALIGVAAQQLLMQTARMQQQVETHSENSTALLQSLTKIERELRQILSRPIRMADGSTSPALRLSTDGEGNSMLEWTATGWMNPLHMPRSNVRREAIALQHDTLTLYRWSILDRTASSPPPSQHHLLQHISGFQVDALDSQGNWHNVWPLTTARGGFFEANANTSEDTMASLPQALRLRLHRESSPLPFIEKLIDLGITPPVTKQLAPEEEENLHIPEEEQGL